MATPVRIAQTRTPRPERKSQAGLFRQVLSTRQLFSSWYLSTTKKKRLSIQLEDGNLFDKSSACRFIWACRIELLSRTPSWYENQFRYVKEDLYSDKDRKHFIREGNRLGLNFLKSLCVIGENNQFSSKFRQMVGNCSSNFARSNADDPNASLGLRHVFMLCVLGTVDDVAKLGLPTNLMEHGTDMAGHFFKAFHFDEWLRAGQVVGGTKWLKGNCNHKLLGRKKTLRG